MPLETLVYGVPVNPELPDGFWSVTPIEMRPEDHLVWLEKPFIQTIPDSHSPSGTRFEVVCFEVSAADRPVLWGIFPTLEEAQARAETGKGIHSSAF